LVVGGGGGVGVGGGGVGWWGGQGACSPVENFGTDDPEGGKNVAVAKELIKYAVLALRC